MRRDLLVERLQDAGAAYLLAPKKVADPLENLGSLALPPAELKNGAQLVSPGLIPGGAAVLLDGANDYVETFWETRTNLAPTPNPDTALGKWSGAAGFWNAAATVTRDATVAVPSELEDEIDAVVKVVASGAAASEGSKQEFAAVIKGKTKTVSVYARGDVGGEKVTLGVGNGTVGIAQKQITLTKSWERYSLTFVPTETGNAPIGFANVIGEKKAQTYYHCALLVEETSTLKDYLPRLSQLASGEAGWSGTAYESASDLGPFARGTNRTFVGVARRDADNDEDTLFGSTVERPLTYIIKGGGVSYFNAGASSSLGTWPAGSKPALYAVRDRRVDGTVQLFLDGEPGEEKANAGTYPAPGGRLVLGRWSSGGSPFVGALLPFAVFLRAVDADEIRALTAAVPSAKVLNEPVDDRLFIKLLGVDGSPARLSGDEPDASGIPMGFKSATSAPGGHVDSSCSLMRDPRRDWPDLNLVDEYIAYGRVRPLGRNVFEGEMTHFPSELGDGASIGVKALGNQVQLTDNENFTGLYAALGFEGWEDAPLARRLSTPTEGRGKIQLSKDVGGLVFTPPNENLKVGETADAVYRAPAGINVAKVGYRGTQQKNWSNFETAKLFGDDSEDLNSIGQAVSLTLDNTARVAEFAKAWRYLMLRASVSAEHIAEVGSARAFDLLSLYGDHGLPLIPIAGGLPGLYAHDVLGHMLETGAPGLNFTIAGDGSIVPNESFVMGDFALLEPTTAKAGVERLNTHFLNNWGVWDDKTFFWQPWDPSRVTWHASIAGGAKWSPAGRQSQTLLSGVVVPYTDHAGVARKAGPPGSGCDYEDASLADSDPNNPYTRRGRPRLGALPPISFPLAYPSQAIQIGAVVMAETKFPQRSGTLIVRPKARGHVPELRHPTLGRVPVWALRAGDYVQLDDWPEPEPFRVISTEYDHDAKTLVAQLETGGARLSAILERAAGRMAGIV